MRLRGDRLFGAFSWVVGLGLLAGLTGLLGVLAVQGGSSLGPGLFFGDTPPMEAILGRSRVFDGIWPAMVGTVCLVLLSALVSIPVGVAAGIHLSEYASARRRRLFLTLCAHAPMVEYHGAADARAGLALERSPNPVLLREIAPDRRTRKRRPPRRRFRRSGRAAEGDGLENR